MNARELMKTQVTVVSPDTPVREVVRILVEQGLRGVPVVSEGVLMGVITESDLLGRAKKIHLPTLFTILDVVIPIAGERQYEEDLRHATASTAQDIMTSELTVASPEDSLADLATLLVEEGVSILPVLDESDTLCGLITKNEVLKAMLSEDRD